MKKSATGESTAREPVIQLRGVTKRFGDTVAVAGLSFEIREGDIFGFIGPNGAGKTTTLKLIATLLTPDSGTIRVRGRSTKTEGRAVRRSIGYMPDFLGIYHGLTVEEYLDFFGATYRIAPTKRRRLIEDLLALTDLAAKKTTLVTSLSRGMQQRLGLARALIHDPSILLLDEPASGLDPRARVEIRELLKELARMGKTIVVSSHILSDLEELSNRIGIIERGEILYCGPIDDALRQIGEATSYEVEIRGNLERAAEHLRALDGIVEVEVDGDRIRLALASDAASSGVLARHLVEGGFDLLTLTRGTPRLEDAFMRITKGKVQ